MFKKEVKTKEKWIIDKFESLRDEQRGLDLVMKSLARQMEWLEKRRQDFWTEVTKKYDLNPDYCHEYQFKTKTINEMYKRIATR